MLTLTIVAALAAAGPSIVSETGDSVIEEIIVTSRFRAEKLSDVPDSITAFTAEDVERYRMERINRVATLTPNLRFSDDQEVGVSTLVIRGVRQNRGTGQPPVSFRIDGVSATNNLLTTQELFDIESIDDVRGWLVTVTATRPPLPLPPAASQASPATQSSAALARSRSGPIIATPRAGSSACARAAGRTGRPEPTGR